MLDDQHKLEPESKLLSSYADHEQRALRLEANQRRKLLQSYDRALGSARDNEELAKKQVLQAEDFLSSLEDQYENILEQLQEASQSHGSPTEKMLILRERLGECMRAIEEQQLALDRAKREEDVALASRLQLEVQTRGMEETKTLEAGNLGEAGSLQRLATLRKDKESVPAEQYRKGSHKLKLLASEERQKQADLDETVLQQAGEGRRVAVERLKIQLGAIRLNESARSSTRITERSRKAAALLQLKRDTEAIKTEIESKNASRQRRLKLREEARTKETEALLKAGKNPYEVFRRREQEEARTREQARVDERRRQQEADFAVEMEKEAVQLEKVTARMTAFEARQVPVKMDDPDRWRNYLEARALPGLELSEITKPGGFLPSKIADPSKILNKYQLGLGIASKSTVDALQKVYHETPSELLIPRSPNKPAPQPSDAQSDGQNASLLSGGGSDEPDGGGNDENVSPGARPRALSTWEARRLAEARARHKETGMTRKQVVWGREFKGAAFLPTPADIVFKDFEVGHTYKTKFTLTNVSYTFNTFKIADLPDAVRDFFVVEYEFPGQVSAGMSCEVTITFTPKVNEDIFEELPVLAATGPMSVPIRCLIKRTVIVTDPPTNRLDFGIVTRAEKCVKTLTIENRGSLPTAFELRELGPEGAPGDSVLSYTKTGAVGGYSKARIDFTYAPLEEGPFRRTLSVTFSAKEVGDLTLDVTGACGDVPIYLESEEADFKCCVYEQVYRNVLVVANRGKTTMKVTLTPPKGLAGCLQIVPELGYVQAGGTFSFQLKFLPALDLLERCAPHSNSATGTLAVPLRLRIPEQTFPVTAVVKATLTSAELRFSPPALDFGTCPVGESVACPLTLSNPSALPLRYGFNPLPKGVSVKPGDGFGSLLPGESVQRSVIFTPHAATLYSFPLPCTSSLAPAQPFKVPCVGLGALAPLVFSANRVELPATPLGSASTATLLLKNVSSAPQSFEFALPDRRDLIISPSIDVIQPGKAATILVEFRPSEDADVSEGSEGDVADVPSDVSRPASGQGRPEVGAQPGTEPETSSRSEVPTNGEVRRNAALCLRQQTVIPCLIRKQKAQAPSEVKITSLVTVEPTPQMNGNAGSTAAVSVTLHLEVHTTAIEPQLAIEDVPGGPDPQGFYPLNFGQVPVGKRVLKTFTVRHVGSRPMSICASPLGHDGIFTRVNALRELFPLEEDPAATCRSSEASGGAGFAGRSTPPAGEEHGTDETRGASRASGEASKNVGESADLVSGREIVSAQSNPADRSASRSSSAAGGPTPSGKSTPGPTAESVPSTSVGAGKSLAAAEPLNPAKRPPTQQKVLVEFAPAARIRYREVMTLFTKGGLGATKLQVLLLGEGISPTMHLDPQITAVNLGHVLAGESVEKGFAIVNTSPFALTFRLRLDGTVQRNRNGMEPIFCKPAEGTIEAGQRAPVAIAFNSDRPGCQYRAKLLVEVPNQDKEVTIDLTGYCWDQALFLTGADPPDDPPTHDTEPGGVPKAVTVTLVTDGAKGLSSRSITVGCAESGKAGGKSATGEFVIEGLDKGSANAAQGWSVDVSKGSLAPGERKTVTFSYSAPQKGGHGGGALIELGELVETKVVLQWKGGAPPPKESQVQLTLRCLPNI
ncbi:hypothetical protein KFL_002590130 [Klebsormidium nitens]|uniref:Uncharacterized protein n=1 Tax=Klebsormidium nitens TaxID=105231 RepID=A0A1Y1I4L8_KLENI|nr:hypothetical protein KFL_002590130 [Klebsormidium nitens]|eukprot:GAQ85885.1 hypothetical protein KFL_002590130 [Klebsormidium nitens]